jgi:hypothetical protein
MNWSLWIKILKSHHIRVFIDNRAGNFSRYDFTKQAIIHKNLNNQADSNCKMNPP